MVEYYGNNDYRDYLMHYGVKGMKWGKHLKKKAYEVKDYVGDKIQDVKRMTTPEYKLAKENNRQNNLRGANRTIDEKLRQQKYPGQAYKTYVEGHGLGKFNIEYGYTDRNRKGRAQAQAEANAAAAHDRRRRELELEAKENQTDKDRQQMYDNAKQMYAKGEASREYLQALASNISKGSINYNNATRYADAVDANKLANARGEKRTAAERRRRTHNSKFGNYVPISGESLAGDYRKIYEKEKKKRRR